MCVVVRVPFYLPYKRDSFLLGYGVQGNIMQESEHLAMVYEEIEGAVRAVQRDLRRGALAYHVQARLPYARHVGSVRRDMLNMERLGMLVRVGGMNARRGYRLPTPVERMAWWLNGGMWPHGADQIQPVLARVG